MSSFALKLAVRELRGGLNGFRIFLLCLMLGVGAIAAVGLVRAAIESGLKSQGAALLGGDVALKFTYRFASDAEKDWMAGQAVRVSEIADFRSMVVVNEETGLTQIKAVDSAYPLVGAVTLTPEIPLTQALALQSKLPGAVMDGVLVARMGLSVGQSFMLGTKSFELTAILTQEPDNATSGFSLGPRTLVMNQMLKGSGLLQEGTMFDSLYRLELPQGTDLDVFKERVSQRWPDGSVRYYDSRRASPGVERFVERMGSFLILVGLAGLAVGGVGISSAVRAYLDGKIATIATLKTLGASGRLIFQVYLTQIALLAGLGVVLGLCLGALGPMIAAPWIAASLPFPVVFGLFPKPLAEAAFYGMTTAFLFTLWPLARSGKVRAAALYRGLSHMVRPGVKDILALLTLSSLLVGGAVYFSGSVKLALGAAGGILGALLVLLAAAFSLVHAAQLSLKWRWLQGSPAVRLALASISKRKSESISVMLSLGLGLSVLAAVGQIDTNLRLAIERDLPDRAPSYFFVDIQKDQIDGFLTRVTGDPLVSKVESAPMLRGVVTKINGQKPVGSVNEHWVVRGDRGLTYAATQPAGTTLTQGTWWPQDYQGVPQISFAAQEAEEINLKLGDTITVNILGRDITAEVTSFRNVDFSSAGMGFVMALNPAAIAGAPHSFIATVYAAEESEAAILRDLHKAYPNITAIRIRDTVARVGEALSAIATATAWAASVTLITGFIVLIGAAAAGERQRIFEAAILKSIGAQRALILGSFALRSALLGAGAGVVAVVIGGIGGWAVMHFVMEVAYVFEPISAILIVFGGALATLLAGLAFSLRPLQARPANILRTQD